jgi:ABC-2 type transport system permease protein
MNGVALRLEVRRIRSLVVWIALVAIAYCGIVAGFYPTFRDNEKAIQQYMGLFPKEMLSIFGMQGSLADPGVFFNIYIGGMLWPVLGTIVAVVLATRPVAGDLDRGFLELPLSTRLSRVRYLGVAIGAQAGALAIVAAAMIAGILVVGRLVGAPYDPAHFALAGVHSWALGIAIAAVATLLSVVTLDRGRAAGISVGLILGMYLLDAASKVWTGIGGWAELSAFHHFQTLAIVDRGEFPVGDFALFLAVALLAWGAALALFRRRDLAA